MHSTGNPWVTQAVPAPTPTLNPYPCSRVRVSAGTTHGYRDVTSHRHISPPTHHHSVLPQHDNRRGRAPGGEMTRVGDGPSSSFPKNGIQINFIIYYIILTEVLPVPFRWPLACLNARWRGRFLPTTPISLPRSK